MSKSRSSSSEPARHRSELKQELAALPPLVAAERLARPTTAQAQRLAELGIDRAQWVIDRYESEARPTEDRRKAGVFYTPAPIIDAMLERMPVDGEWLDPAAGAGAFLVGLARRFGPDILSRLSACDIDADALSAAALALEAALGAEHRKAVATWRRTRAHAIDFLRQDLPGRRPDLIVGNPPYGLNGGDDLTSLFSELGGERDLYACFLLRAGEVVRPSGTVSLLVPDTWLTNRNATGLRAALVRRGLSRIVDFGKPFTTARDTRVHAVFLRSEAATCEVESQQGEALVRMEAAPQALLTAAVRRGWFLYRTTGEAAACRHIEAAAPLSAHLDVVYGLRTGDNATHVRPGTGPVPLVAGRDLAAYDRAPSTRHLAKPQNFTAVDRQRGRWKLGIQRIRTNSKVPWRRWVEAALLQPHEVGLDSLTLVADRESQAEPSELLLHTLGVLNSSILNRWYRLTFTDVNVKPVYVNDLPLPPVDARLVRLVRQRIAQPGELRLERAIDRLVAEAYGLTGEQIDCLESGFWGAAREPLPTIESASALAA